MVATEVGSAAKTRWPSAVEDHERLTNTHDSSSAALCGVPKLQNAVSPGLQSVWERSIPHASHYGTMGGMDAVLCV
jgi:hypothetical protein